MWKLNKLDPFGHVLLIGNPDIGKTWSLNFRYRAVCEKKRRLAILKSSTKWHVFTPNGKCWQYEKYLGAAFFEQLATDGDRGLLLYVAGGQGARPFNYTVDYELLRADVEGGHMVAQRPTDNFSTNAKKVTVSVLYWYGKLPI